MRRLWQRILFLAFAAANTSFGRVSHRFVRQLSVKHIPSYTNPNQPNRLFPPLSKWFELLGRRQPVHHTQSNVPPPSTSSGSPNLPPIHAVVPGAHRPRNPNLPPIHPAAHPPLPPGPAPVRIVHPGPPPPPAPIPVYPPPQPTTIVITPEHRPHERPLPQPRDLLPREAMCGTWVIQCVYHSGEGTYVSSTVLYTTSTVYHIVSAFRSPRCESASRVYEFVAVGTWTYTRQMTSPNNRTRVDVSLKTNWDTATVTLANRRELRFLQQLCPCTSPPRRFPEGKPASVLPSACRRELCHSFTQALCQETGQQWKECVGYDHYRMAARLDFFDQLLHGTRTNSWHRVTDCDIAESLQGAIRQGDEKMEQKKAGSEQEKAGSEPKKQQGQEYARPAELRPDQARRATSGAARTRQPAQPKSLLDDDFSLD
ncbi:unnamed protein product [Vitrella brassicaformis CCMP3155]|uniref:Uncharacterized protein n=2 Tax=Vitrella brassicaformis TaxID=1169539 RepID=A0A0G4FKW2_VITBC|nr:unnamed protein product [Vitrella brassicaformis CCMP3155]|eukprot:CEM14601.1 unnamed protein product [Vitrella brassicaformis CCMP3155]